MDKLISQQAAIEAVEFGITYAKAINKETGEVIELFKQSNEELRKAVERIMRLPSAEQEAPDINVGNMEDCISRKAAIDCLNNVSFDCSMDQEVVEEELLKLPPVHPTIFKTENVDGAISRRAAIESLTEYGNGRAVYIGVKEAVRRIEQLPSAQPDTTTHDSIPAETGKNDGDGTSGDCISRQQAIDVLEKMQTYKLFAGDDMILIDKAQVQTELMMLPPAEPKMGRWILDRSGQYCCSECMEPCAGYVMMKPRDKFCKMCGAKMEGGEAE